MNWLKLTILSVLLGFSGLASAQQLPLYSTYSENRFVLNPGMTGWDQVTAITASYRHQWASMPQAPRTATLSFRHFMPDQNMGVGGYLWYDQAGPTSFWGLTGSYAYNLRFENRKNRFFEHRLSIGVSLSFMQYRLKGADLTFNDPDVLEMQNNESRFLPDAGIGAIYYNEWVYAGFSVPQLMSLKVRYKNNDNWVNMRRVAHFYVHGGVKIPFLKGTNIRGTHFLVPTALLKYAPHAPVNLNVGLQYFWNRTLGIGVNYSTDGTLGGDIHVNVYNYMRFGYSFGIGVNGLAPHLGTNHEIMITYIMEDQGDDWIFPSPKASPRKKLRKSDFSARLGRKQLRRLNRKSGKTNKVPMGKKGRL